MIRELGEIDFKLVFDKLLEINERSVEQLIKFKDMLNKNNDQFDDILKKIEKITDNIKIFETQLEIFKSKKVIDKIESIDIRTTEEFKNIINILGDLKLVVSDIHNIQSQFKQETKDELKEINNILNSVSKNQENFQSKNTIMNDDIKEIKRIVDEFNKKVIFENKLNRVITLATATLVAAAAFFTIISKY